MRVRPTGTRGGKLAGIIIGITSTMMLGVASVVAQPPPCIGDCDGDGVVTVDEVLLAINIALGIRTVDACSAFDRDGNGLVTVDEILTGVSNALEGCPAPAPQPIFPANYRDSFIEVRSCRFSIEHGGASIRVLVDQANAQAYLDEANPMPVGSIVVKEEFLGPDCTDPVPDRWRVMRKEAPGFDPEDGNWAWQWVDADRSVLLNDKQTCIGCHNTPACNARDKMCTEDEEAPEEWRFVLESLGGALLSITGTSPTDVYAVGADPGDAFGPLFLHYDGTRWQRYDTGASGNLWWISVEPVDGSFFLAGENGLIIQYDIGALAFSRHAVPSASPTMYGIWAAAGDDVWAVGGRPENPENGGVIWHFDGAAWRAVDTTGIRPGGVPTLFKVWGRNADEVYAVGFDGVALRFDGHDWHEIESGTTRTLFTIHGNDTLVAASGGFISGVLVEDSGSGFNDVAPRAAEQMNGVFIRPDGRGLAAGIGGWTLERIDGVWQRRSTELDTFLDFHAAWIDPDGGRWAVGGDLTVALNQGMLAYAGSASVSSDLRLVPPCELGVLAPASTVSYFDDVRPILQRAGCQTVACHGGPFPSSGYDMRTYASAFGPGVQAALFGTCNIVPGDPEASYLIEKLQTGPRFGGRMPSLLPPLSDDDIDVIRTWILEGAGDDSPATPTATQTALVAPTPTPTRTLVANAPTLSPACDVPGTVCTVAGTGMSLFDGDGPALARSFYFPIDVTFDADGRALVLDWNNLRLRRLNHDGYLETIMGMDFEDFPIEGALAIETPLHHASNMKFDPAGNLFIAGDHVPVVFRVGTDDRVYTVAGTTTWGYAGDGGPALEASLSTPFGVLPDGRGGLYIADVDAHVIRFVRADGIIETFAGTGERGYSGDGGPATEARLNGPARMALGADGGLYFCETRSHIVRKVDTDGVISTVAGTGVRGYSGDGGPATLASLDSPYDVRFAPSGLLYIADSGNHVIRRIHQDGTIHTVVGNGESGFAGDGGDAANCVLNRPSALAFGPDGSLWICDTLNHRLRRIAGYTAG